MLLYLQIVPTWSISVFWLLSLTAVGSYKIPAEMDQCLPTEIFEKIFSYIPLKADLINCATVSTVFRPVAEKFLYHSISFEIDRPLANRNQPWWADSINERFRRSLKEHPHLFLHVRKLHLEVHDWYWYGHPFGPQGGHYLWIQSLASLRHLAFNPPPPYDSNVGALPLGLYVSSMRLDFWYDRRTFWRSHQKRRPRPRLDLALYLWKPTLRKLQIEHISFAPRFHAHDFAPISVANRYGTSLIDDLSFFDGSPRMLGLLPKILLSIRRLKRFALETNLPWPVTRAARYHHRYWNHEITPHDIGLEMQPHARTLEELFVAFSDGAGFLRISTMYQLRDFTCLRRLAIPEEFLVAFDGPTFHETLRDQLEELQIQYSLGFTYKDPTKPLEGYQYRIARMKKLAKYRTDHLLSLKRIVWWYQQCYTWTDSTTGPIYDHVIDLEQLRDSFAELGVNFEFISTPYFGHTPFAERLNIEHQTKIQPHDVQLRKGEPVDGPALYWNRSTKSVF